MTGDKSTGEERVTKTQDVPPGDQMEFESGSIPYFFKINSPICPVDSRRPIQLQLQLNLEHRPALLLSLCCQHPGPQCQGSKRVKVVTVINFNFHVLTPNQIFVFVPKVSQTQLWVVPLSI